MTRRWNEFVATLQDIVPGGLPVLALLLLVIAAIVALLWYHWPPRLPSYLRGGGGGRDGSTRGRWRWRWPAWRWRFRWRLRWLFRWRLRWRRRGRRSVPELDELSPDVLPDLPAGVLALTADQFAAAGRYAEAVRERLRAIVKELIDREVIEHRPGWTVTELARAASLARPATAPSLTGASDTFSGIWYGQRPAGPEDDLRMRRYGSEVHDALAVARMESQ